VRWNHQANDEGGPGIALGNEICNAQKHAPTQFGGKAMRNWIRREIEWRNGEESRHNTYLLDSEQQQDRPKKVRKLRGKNENAEGSLWRSRFCGERNGKVSEEHVPAYGVD
jgi:hypothetical protein